MNKIIWEATKRSKESTQVQAKFTYITYIILSCKRRLCQKKSNIICKLTCKTIDFVFSGNESVCIPEQTLSSHMPVTLQRISEDCFILIGCWLPWRHQPQWGGLSLNTTKVIQYKTSHQVSVKLYSKHTFTYRRRFKV